MSATNVPELQPDTAMCEHCGKVLSKSHIGGHVRSVHLKIRDFVCSTCGAAFFTKSKLQYHYSKHSEVRNFACSRSICQKAFKTRSDMLQHEKTHDLGPFTCSYCSTVVTKRKEFEQHVRTCSYKPVVPRKSRSSEQIRKFTCVICSKSFKRPFHLKRHKRSVHENERKFKCDKEDCSKTFNDVTDLKKHVKIVHMRFRSAKCNLCSAEFPFPSALTIHMKVFHAGFGTLFSCDLCKRTFSRIESIRRHMTATHLNGEKNKKKRKSSIQENAIKLELPETFEIQPDPLIEIKEEKSSESESESLFNNVKLVGDCLKLECVEEDYSYPEMNHSDSDQESQTTTTTEQEEPAEHDKKSPKKLEPTSFQCEKCSKIFDNNQHFRYHVKFAHLDEEPKFICEILDCKKSFNFASILKRHQSVQHGVVFDEKVKCPDCLKIYSDKYNLEKHRKFACPMRKDKLLEKPKFKCEYCEKEFSRQRGYKSHVSFVHEGRKDFVCKVEDCKRDFAHQRSLKQHYFDYHKEYYMEVVCKECGKTCDDKDSLEKHQQESHNKDVRHTCPVCKKLFCRKNSLTRHMNSVHSSKKLACNVEGCDKIFTNNLALKTHLSICHEKAASCYCSFCDEGFSYRRDLKRHLYQVHENGKLKTRTCKKCNSEFKNCQDFFTHITSHDGYFICKLCGSYYSNEAMLKVHMAEHRNWKKDMDTESYFCDKCGIKYYNRSSLATHMRKHSNIKPFACDTCGKRFITPSHLLMHETTHKKFKFTCEICKKGFQARSTYDFHLRYHTDKPFECNICSKKFDGQHNFKVHMEFHAGKFKCPKCQKILSSKQWLNAHTKKCGRPFVVMETSICD